MTHFMGDHIGLGEVARGGKALFQFAEELQIQVDPLIARAVEGADRRVGETAGGIDPAAKQHQGRVAV
ncbi:hypothetical protein D3C80_2065320 [compost metagenome]